MVCKAEAVAHMNTSQEKKAVRTLGRNFLYNVIYQMLLIVIPLLTTPYIARVLGAERVGIYTYTYTVANYFVLFAMLGQKNYGNRSIAVVRDDRVRLRAVFSEIYGLQALCGVICIAVYVLFCIFFGGENRLYFYIEGLYVLSALFDISWFFMGLEQFRVTVSRSIVIRLLTLIAIFVFVRDEGDLAVYALIMALGMLLSQLTLWYCLPRYLGSRKEGLLHPTVRACLRHLPSELVLFIPVIAVSLYKMMDKLLLKGMSTYTEVGFFESADRIIGIPLGVITALGTVMLPRMSHLAAADDREQSAHYIRMSMRFAMFLGVGMMCGLYAVAEDFVPLFLGEGYTPVITLLRLLTPTVLFIAWANVIRTQYLIPNHRDTGYIVSVLLGAAVNLALNLLLIPYMQATGAVIATLGAEGVVCISQTVMVRKTRRGEGLPIGLYFLDTLPYLIPGGLMVALIRVLRPILHRVMAPGGVVLCEIAVGLGFYLLTAGAVFVLQNRKKKNLP